MLRVVVGAASVLLFILAGFFLVRGPADAEDPIPKAPAPEREAAAPAQSPAEDNGERSPPAATEKSKEEKRFGRADKDKDGKITLEEMYQPRRKAFAKL